MFRFALILTIGVMFCLQSAANGLDHHRRQSTCESFGPTGCVFGVGPTCDGVVPGFQIAGGQQPVVPGTVPPPGRSSAGNAGTPPGNVPGPPEVSDPEIVRVLTESVADVPSLRTVQISGAIVNGGTILLRGALTMESQRALLKTSGEAALRGYIDRGILRWPANTAPPVLDVSQLVLNGGTDSLRRPRSGGIDPHTIAAAARELAADSTSKFAVGLPGVSTLPAIDADSRDVAEAYFGDGFHAYWNNDLRGALSRFSTAVDFCHDDARFWYYKGLTEYRLGDSASANVSFAKAVLRHQDSQSKSRIARALERVQGDTRQRLEMARLLVGSKQQPASALVASQPTIAK